MSSRSVSMWARGWRGGCLVAITYVYFLIFAQFAFLHRLGEIGLAETHLQAVMAAMAIGGISFSLLATLKAFEAWPRLRVQFALAICALAALCTLLPLDLPASIATAFLIGSGLGLLTVTLVSNLRLWIGTGDGILPASLGTGVGYFLCNVPGLFTATPQTQALIAAGLCAIGILAAGKIANSTEPVSVESSPKPTPFALVLIAFTALVWLDSAAFFIIQNTPSLKASTWEGTVHLWTNAFLHLAAAILSGFILRRLGLRSVLAIAALALSAACILLHQPNQAVLASLFYPFGVSFYSVALVAYPSLLPQSSSHRLLALRAGFIYAIAGWIGSAMGIGMAQHLRQVPILFVALAAALVLAPSLLAALRSYPSEVGLISAILALALLIDWLIPASNSSPEATASMTAQERGRMVYISEGCIHCHSQYVRSNTKDVLLWGPAQTIEELRSQHPPLIGNRRQGPDLSQVGGRRSPLWLRAHFFSPAEVSHGSFMPSYAYLFQNSTRGDDLVSYLLSLKSATYERHMALEQAWQSNPTAVADPEVGARLYTLHCATCHETNGKTRRRWVSSFKRLPPDIHKGPFIHLQTSASNQLRLLDLARIIKFGIPGTDMPGHEYLSDQDVSSLALWLDEALVLPEHLASIPRTARTPTSSSIPNTLGEYR